MANIAVASAGRIRIVESIIQDTKIALEAIVAGAPVRKDTATGKFTNANATTAAEARVWGIAKESVAAGMPVTAIRLGVLDGYTLTSQAYDAAIYLSDTDGRLADAAGTVSAPVGRVIAGTATTLGTAYDKLLFVDCSVAEGFVNTESRRLVVNSELLATSVDTHVFVADRAYQVMAVNEIHSVVGSTSAAVRPRKITDTSAPGAAVSATVKELTTAAADLTATINTTQALTLSATAADLLLAAGDKIALDFSGTLTGLVGVISISLKAV